jgi:hypothetical protein
MITQIISKLLYNLQISMLLCPTRNASLQKLKTLKTVWLLSIWLNTLIHPFLWRSRFMIHGKLLKSCMFIAWGTQLVKISIGAIKLNLMPWINSKTTQPIFSCKHIIWIQLIVQFGPLHVRSTVSPALEKLTILDQSTGLHQATLHRLLALHRIGLSLKIWQGLS